MADPLGDGEGATLFPKTAGERLRDAREAMGLDLGEVASRTRIPLRHLETIETSNYGSLPSSTYAIGFAKGYARAVGVDEVDIARMVRSELDQTNYRNPEYTPYEMDDPARVPPRGLALGAVIVAILLLIGVGLWYGTSLFRGDSAAPPVASAEEAPAPIETAMPLPPAPSDSGQVTLIATDTVWLKIYDATGKTLFEKTTAPGERYDVPQDANNPMINVGRPDQIQVTLNGSSLPSLGTGAVAIKDVGVSAAALTARGSDLATPQSVLLPSPSPTPSATSTASTQAPRKRRPAASPSRSTPVPVVTPGTTPTPAATSTP
ncbi:hypothetical protein BH09PSE4_BH09PSE4_00760 [soil metagenome]